MRKQFLIKNYLICIFVFTLFLSKIKTVEEEFDFLKDKTIDNLRQIFWTAMNLLKENGQKNNEERINEIYESLWKSHNRQEIKDKIINEFYLTMRYIKENETLFNQTKNNTFFQINNINDLKNLVKNEKLPKNFLINIAFNIDKYDRTERQAINSASDYINYYTREQLKEFINNKIDEYFNLTTSAIILNKIVLNNYFFDSKETTSSYISSKSIKEYIQYIYGFEKYCFHSNKTVEEACYLAYNLYTHTKLNSYSQNDFSIKISTFNRKLNLDKNLDDFIFLIENRRFTYPNNKDLLKPLYKEQLISNILAFETYFKRQTNTTSSLKQLKSYIEGMNDKHMRDILDWGISLYPELGQLERFQDITSSENNLQYGQVKQFVKITDRDELLKYAYNIHTYQNKIKSIYDSDIYDFIRMNDNTLYDKIFKDTNNNNELQEKGSFTLFANLHANNFEQYINNLQRNQLKIVVYCLIDVFYEHFEYNDGDQVKIPSEKKEKLDLLESANNQELIDMAIKYGAYTKIQNTKNIFEYDFDYNRDNHIVSKYFIYTENIMDFFRSTDINYLRLWLRKYEIIIRKIKSKRYLSGGLKTNFMNINEYSKNILLSNFDEYVFEYPDMFSPENFIKIVGLDKGITPHKFLVENAEDRELIKNIAFSMIGHLQRKNVQTNFDWEEIISNFISYNIYHKNIIIKNREIYQLFRMINICPELNNINLFKIMCVNKETRIINTQEIVNNDIEIFNFEQEKINNIVENIDYYYKQKGLLDEIKSHEYEPKNYKTYISNFLKKPDISNNEILKSRVIDGDFYPMFYDYCLFLKDEKKEVINNIYNILSAENKTENITLGDDDIDKKIKAISQAINDYKELQDPSEFDKNYNYINIISEGYTDVNIIELHNFLNNSSIREVFYYCLIANILAIENKEEINKNKEYIRDIYLKIHYMPKISMIRYILDVAKLKGRFTEKLSPKNLPILVKKYMLDIGSDNIYDLTIY